MATDPIICQRVVLLWILSDRDGVGIVVDNNNSSRPFVTTRFPTSCPLVTRVK
jgi:hypothetical protein